MPRQTCFSDVELWIFHIPGAQGSRFSVRYAAREGVASLRCRVTDDDVFRRGGQAVGLRADQLLQASISHVTLAGGVVEQVYVLWGEDGAPEALPAGRWLRVHPLPVLPGDEGLPMLLADDVLIEAPEDDTEDDDTFEDEDTVADDDTETGLSPVGFPAMLALPSPERPTGLIRHLRRTIDRQRQALEVLGAVGA